MKTHTITQQQLDEAPPYRYPGVNQPGEYTYSEADNLYRPVSQSQASPQPDISGGDFDRGFGIGGLGRYQEDPIIPSVTAIERVERMEARARTCRRCGQSDVFDGAMFTTDASSGLCDECYG